jgi:hypothetical protein
MHAAVDLHTVQRHTQTSKVDLTLQQKQAYTAKRLSGRNTHLSEIFELA